MADTFITHLQLFGIGLGFGVAGPCLFRCIPIVLLFTVEGRSTFRAAICDAAIFLSGRLGAYTLLGAAAGFSALLLRRFTGPDLSKVFTAAAGGLTVLFGLFMLSGSRRHACGLKAPKDGFYTRGGLFAIGLMMALAPCAPLAALLVDLAIISRNALEGASYALSFGLGTFFSGLLIVGLAAGGLSELTGRFLASKALNMASRLICAALLIIIGAGMIIGGLGP